ncbi:MAG: CoA-binding protein [Anaerolineaceae bacterium]|nr:CoA-binding protein [Anaerolineaceae bacterium]
MNPAVAEFVEGKRVALVGVSRSGKKFGNSILSELKDRGYQVRIVHPEAQEIGGEPCYPSLAALQGEVDRVIICVPPNHALQALRDAAAAGITKIWLQQGADSAEVMAEARKLGISPITGKCILMYAQPVRSFHGWHRAFARLTGQL